MATSHLGLCQHKAHISSAHSKPSKNRPLWTYNLRQLIDRYIRPIIVFPKLVVRAVGLLLYFLYRYERTRSCRRRGCQRHSYALYKGLREVPRDLCIDRKRDVTPPPRKRWYHRAGVLVKKSSSSRRERYEQVQSPLFAKLPGEIRGIIYEYAIAGRALWVEQRFGRMMCEPVVIEETKYRPLELLVTCRKIYVEAIEILYARNILFMKDPLVFFDFSATVLPKRLEAIRYLVFCFPGWNCLMGEVGDSSVPMRLRHYASKDTWEVIWESIETRFTNLRTVAVSLTTDYSFTAAPDAFKSLLKVSERAKVLVHVDGRIRLDCNPDWARNAQFTVQHCGRGGEIKYLGRRLEIDVGNLKRLDDETELPCSLSSMR